MWKLIVIIGLIAVIMLSAILGGISNLNNNEWDRIANAYSFDLIKWEFENIFDKWTHRIEQISRDDELSESDEAQLVNKYLSLTQQIQSLSVEIEQEIIKGTGGTPDVSVREEQLVALKEERDALEGQVEEIIEKQTSAVLSSEGLSWTLKLGAEVEVILPPVDFAFEERPHVLVVSPRDRIEIEDTTLLRPDITLDEKLVMEEDVEARGYSALVIQVGAIASYPSMVPNSSSLDSILSKVAHEWVHHYMYFRPLGQGYWSDYDMLTINETVADIIGDEVSELVYERYYKSDKPDVITPSANDTSPSFDFAREMREIRIKVDSYLEQGEIEEAEAYMAEKRNFLAENGYYIRKLNQAYFAFHGTYADSPTSVNPIGGQLRELREQSDSLKNFIDVVSGISSYDDFLELMNGIVSD